MRSQIYKNISYKTISDVKFLMEQEQTVRDVTIIDNSNSEFQNTTKAIDDIITPAKNEYKNMQRSADGNITWSGKYDNKIEWDFDFNSRTFTITADNEDVTSDDLNKLRKMIDYFSDTLSTKKDVFK